MVSGLAAGVPMQSSATDDTVEQLNDLKRALPTELTRIGLQIAKLEKEHEQLEACKTDLTENLFEGFEDGQGSADGVGGLAAWRRLNEFKADMQGEKRALDVEILRVET